MAETGKMMEMMMEMMKSQREQSEAQKNQSEAQLQLLREQMERQNETIQELLRERSSTVQSVTSEGRVHNGPSIDALEKQIRMFSYRPEDGLTFDQWMERHREIFENDFSGLEDGDKGRILLRKIDDKADKQFRNHIRPKSPAELTFEEIVSVMKDLFGDKRTQFEKRLDLFQLKMSKLRCEDLKEFSSIVNKVYEDANISDMTPEQFKAMILLSEIDLPRYTATLFHVMNQIGEETPNMDTVLKVADSYRKVYGDAQAATGQGGQMNPVVNAASKYNPKWHSRSNRESPRNGDRNGMNESFCSRCGRDEHSMESCPHINSTCFKCEQMGHLSNMCNKWNRSSSRNGSRESINMICSGLSDGIEQFKAKVEMKGRTIEMLNPRGEKSDFLRGRNDVFPKCANGTRLKLTGKCTLTLEMNGKEAREEVYTSNTNLNILGRNFVGKFFRMVPEEKSGNTFKRSSEPVCNEEMIHSFMTARHVNGNSRVEVEYTGPRDKLEQNEVKKCADAPEKEEVPGQRLISEYSDKEMVEEKEKETKVSEENQVDDREILNDPIAMDKNEQERLIMDMDQNELNDLTVSLSRESDNEKMGDFERNSILSEESVQVKELVTEGELEVNEENEDGVLDAAGIEPRRSTRNRKPTERFDIDPTKKSYRKE